MTCDVCKKIVTYSVEPKEHGYKINLSLDFKTKYAHTSMVTTTYLLIKKSALGNDSGDLDASRYYLPLQNGVNSWRDSRPHSTNFVANCYYIIVEQGCRAHSYKYFRAEPKAESWMFTSDVCHAVGLLCHLQRTFRHG